MTIGSALFVPFVYSILSDIEGREKTCLSRIKE
nr:MAG TPA: hypothetical protein [Caudoviricetes sp.]